jgi:hypothetical protein
MKPGASSLVMEDHPYENDLVMQDAAFFQGTKTLEHKLWRQIMLLCCDGYWHSLMRKVIKNS